jgi:uncharacterized protein YecT (DUF1311 family)
VFRAIVMLCALSLPATAQQVVCGEMRTQADMNACQKGMFDAVNARLAAINADVLAGLVQPGDRFPQYGITEVDRMIRAQTAWAAYRDAQCDVDVALSRGGSEEEMYYYACLQEMTEARIAALAGGAPQD